MTIEDEVRERWGDTDRYKQSATRTSAYTAEDWSRIHAEAEDIEARMAEQFAAGADPAGTEAIALAEEWRLHVGRTYYDCPPELLRGLGAMYVEDPRFTAHYDGPDGERAGFAEWVRDAWTARADQG